MFYSVFYTFHFCIFCSSSGAHHTYFGSGATHPLALPLGIGGIAYEFSTSSLAPS